MRALLAYVSLFLLFGKFLSTIAFVDMVPRPTVANVLTRRGYSKSSSTGVDLQQSGEKNNKDSTLTFRHSSKVFIEMTDMYGIVYHANYITYMKRAMERFFGSPAPRVHGIHDMKYRIAATLGEEAVVEGSLVSCNPARERSRWYFQVTAGDPSRLFVAGEATLSWPATSDGPAGALPPGQVAPPSAARAKEDSPFSRCCDDATTLVQPLPKAFVDAPKIVEVTVWTDDLEYGVDGVAELSTRAVFIYFERIRTLCVGVEPDGELRLTRLHREGSSVVVTNIADLRVRSKGVVAGEKLEVRLGAKLTRGNKIVNVYETLWRRDGTLVAHAEIVLLCMDNETRKFRPLPSWFQDIINVPLAMVAD